MNDHNQKLLKNAWRKSGWNEPTHQLEWKLDCCSGGILNDEDKEKIKKNLIPTFCLMKDSVLVQKFASINTVVWHGSILFNMPLTNWSLSYLFKGLFLTYSLVSTSHWQGSADGWALHNSNEIITFWGLSMMQCVHYTVTMHLNTVTIYLEKMQRRSAFGSGSRFTFAIFDITDFSYPNTVRNY